MVSNASDSKLMDLPSRICKATPLKIERLPNVTTKDGTAPYA
jgi:hypothetical protein